MKLLIPPFHQLPKSRLVAYLYGLYGNKKRPIAFPFYFESAVGCKTTY